MMTLKYPISFCKTICFVLLFMYGLVVHAQVIDSLEAELARKDLPTQQRVNVLNLLARDLSYVNQQKAIQYGSEALRLSQQIRYKSGMAYAHRNLASSYSYFGSFYLTMSNLQRAIPVFEELGDSLGIANCYISLGNTYRRLNNYEKELYYHQRAYEIVNRLENRERIGVTAHNLGESYLRKGQLTESEILTRSAMNINQKLHNLPVLSSCYKVMGKIFLARLEYDSAMFYFNNVLSLTKTLGENSQKIAEAESRIALAEIYLKRQMKKERLAMLEATEVFVRTNALNEYVKPVYLALIEEYSSRNEQQKVQKVVQQFRATEELILQQQLKDRNQLIESMAMFFKLEEEIKQLEGEATIQQQAIASRNRLLLVAALSAVLMLILLLLLAKNNAQLKKSNETLRAQDALIQEQNAELKALNATKDKFFSIVSHDLRAPLNSLWAFSTIILENMHELSKEQLRHFSKELRQLVERTMKMTDNLIAWAKVQMNDSVVHPELIALKNFLPEVCQLYEDIAGAKHLHLSYDIASDITVFSDKDQLSLIIRNLISNAIKYSHEGSTIAIGAFEENGKVNISVTDTGIGMNIETLESVFGEAPIQSTRGTSGESGTGLGLKLSREFAMVNGGTLSASSSPGKGTVFTLSLPAAKEK
ncbi:MAG: tetratricopeptide repeat protein [Bacteroidetes bacterium]|nr:tetratricopeptide repeat protein [Bacteroidota bacterium]